MNANVWSLGKHENIKLVLLQLQMQLGKNSFDFGDIQGNDFLGVWLFNPRQNEVRAYIHMHGQAKGLYGLHLEYPAFSGGNYRDELQIFEDQSIDQIVNALEIHFEVVALN